MLFPQWLGWLLYEIVALSIVALLGWQALRWNDRVFRRKFRELVPELRDATDAEVDRYMKNAKAKRR